MKGRYTLSLPCGHIDLSHTCTMQHGNREWVSGKESKRKAEDEDVQLDAEKTKLVWVMLRETEIRRKNKPWFVNGMHMPWYKKKKMVRNDNETISKNEAYREKQSLLEEEAHFQKNPILEKTPTTKSTNQKRNHPGKGNQSWREARLGKQPISKGKSCLKENHNKSPILEKSIFKAGTLKTQQKKLSERTNIN